ncbi:hypothetical protein [Noviherbaspirillum pedocola]|uniref:Uncharacterized protein n=1 Tax=Noviherbaspirillum pedocola TaxID=2801341 RepID=A0A934W9K7_9BURK|nr:hypothetical protein [Noviherbaspirillum pedocola]MBK4739045.1 hypothetical protein [Noviherbaspirillum pedocola]
MRNAEELPASRGSAPEDPGRGADYRSPHHIELRYDGLLSTRPGMSDPEALRQLALPNPLFAQHHARSARSRKRYLTVLVWLALGLVGLFFWNAWRGAAGSDPADIADNARAQPTPPDAPAAHRPRLVMPLTATGDIADTHQAGHAANAVDAADARDGPPLGLLPDSSASMPPLNPNASVGAARVSGENTLREVSSRTTSNAARGCDDAVKALGLCQTDGKKAADALGALPFAKPVMP